MVAFKKRFTPSFQDKTGCMTLPEPLLSGEVNVAIRVQIATTDVWLVNNVERVQIADSTSEVTISLVIDGAAGTLQGISEAVRARLATNGLS